MTTFYEYRNSGRKLIPWSLDGKVATSPEGEQVELADRHLAGLHARGHAIVRGGLELYSKRAAERKFKRKLP